MIVTGRDWERELEQIQIPESCLVALVENFSWIMKSSFC